MLDRKFGLLVIIADYKNELNWFEFVNVEVQKTKEYNVFFA